MPTMVGKEKERGEGMQLKTGMPKKTLDTALCCWFCFGLFPSEKKLFITFTTGIRFYLFSYLNIYILLMFLYF